MAAKYEVAVNYFCNYHVDPMNEAVHGPGWTEWELIKRAEPKFPGHYQPQVPSWGYEDESDPAVMAKKVAAAADHGVTVFIFDWHWYDDGQFLHRALEEGFLQAPNNDRLRFAVMWGNTDWCVCPIRLCEKPPAFYQSADVSEATKAFAGRMRHQPFVRNRGQVTLETFEKLTDHLLTEYFRHPSYWVMDGCPYFSIYNLWDLVKGLGGEQAARRAIDGFRDRVRKAGFPDLHLNAIYWGAWEREYDVLGFDSATPYVWVHHIPIPTFPATPYRQMLETAVKQWPQIAEEFDSHGTPFYPNVTMGWDPSPRAMQCDTFVNAGYPFSPTISENTPEAFKEALHAARRFLDGRPAAQRILTINAWNEWAEGNRIEPEVQYGMGYLEAIRDVFPPDS